MGPFRTIFITFNGILACISLAGLVLSFLWLSYFAKLDENDALVYMSECYLYSAAMIAAGCVLVAMFIGGAFSAWGRNNFTLTLYWMAALPLAIATLVFTLTVFTYLRRAATGVVRTSDLYRSAEWHPYEHSAETQMRHALETNARLQLIQFSMECCGISGPTDYPENEIPLTCCPMSVWYLLPKGSFCPVNMAVTSGCLQAVPRFVHQIQMQAIPILIVADILLFLSAIMSLKLTCCCQVYRPYHPATDDAPSGFQNRSSGQRNV